MEDLGLLRTQAQVGVDEAGDQAGAGRVEFQGGQQAQAFDFDLGPIAFGNLHFCHQGGGDGVGLVEVVAPVEAVELDGLEVEFEDGLAKEFDGVAVGRFSLGGVVGKNNDRVDRLAIFLVEAGEVEEHALVKAGFVAGLGFNVDQEMDVLAGELGLNEAVDDGLLETN